MSHPKSLIRLFLAAVVGAAAAAPAWAQEMQNLPASGLASQSLRPYWHVFIAYAIAILVVLGWVVSISRRLRDVEERLEE